jgi:hypothetical protein
MTAELTIILNVLIYVYMCLKLHKTWQQSIALDQSYIFLLNLYAVMKHGKISVARELFRLVDLVDYEAGSPKRRKKDFPSW